MKTPTVLLGMVLTLGLVLVEGCKKSQPGGEAPPPMVIEGVNVDLPKLLQSVVVSTNIPAQNAFRQVQMSFRYGQYEKAASDMDQAIKTSGLNEEQTKLAGEVLDQIKQVVAKAGPVRK